MFYCICWINGLSMSSTLRCPSLSLISYYAFCSFLKFCVKFYVFFFFFLAWEKLSTFYPFKPKEANILFLGQDMIYKQSVILSLSDLVLLSLSFAFFFFFFFGSGDVVPLSLKVKEILNFFFFFFLNWE